MPVGRLVGLKEFLLQLSGIDRSVSSFRKTEGPSETLEGVFFDRACLGTEKSVCGSIGVEKLSIRIDNENSAGLALDHGSQVDWA